MRTVAGPHPDREQGAAVSIRCAAMLDGPIQDLDVLAVFPAAVYLATRQPQAEVVALLASDAVVHPAAFVLAAPSSAEPFIALDRATPAIIGAGRLRVGGHEMRVGRWYDPVPHLRVPDPERLAIGARALGAALGRVRRLSLTAGRPDRHGHVGLQDLRVRLGLRLEELATALADDDSIGAVAAVDALLGSGPGLTPTGDDMLAGLLATLHHLRRLPRRFPLDVEGRCAEGAVRAHVRVSARSRTTLLSATLLEHALDGAVAGPVARLLRALTADAHSGEPVEAGPIPEAIDAVIGIGATSGHDLLAGIAVAFELAAAEGTVRAGVRSAVDDEGAS
jgi:hypothetical protein